MTYQELKVMAKRDRAKHIRRVVYFVTNELKVTTKECYVEQYVHLGVANCSHLSLSSCTRLGTLVPL